MIQILRNPEYSLNHGIPRLPIRTPSGDRIGNLKIHRHGYIIGGNHHRGLILWKNSLIVIKQYLKEQLENRNLVIKRQKNRKFKYILKKQPEIELGIYCELALRRAQHCIRDFDGIITTKTNFTRNYEDIVTNLIGTYKA